MEVAQHGIGHTLVSAQQHHRFYSYYYDFIESGVPSVTRHIILNDTNKENTVNHNTQCCKTHSNFKDLKMLKNVLSRMNEIQYYCIQFCSQCCLIAPNTIYVTRAPPPVIYSVLTTPLNHKPASPTAYLMSPCGYLKNHTSQTEFSIAFPILAYSNSILPTFQAQNLGVNKF